MTENFACLQCGGIMGTGHVPHQPQAVHLCRCHGSNNEDGQCCKDCQPQVEEHNCGCHCHFDYPEACTGLHPMSCSHCSPPPREERDLRKKVFRFAGVMQTMKDGKELENYANGFIKDIEGLFHSQLQEVREKTEGLKMSIDEQAREVLKSIGEFPLGYYKNIRNETLDSVLQALDEMEGKE